jgi:hypothetical protein
MGGVLSTSDTRVYRHQCTSRIAFDSSHMARVGISSTSHFGTASHGGTVWIALCAVAVLNTKGKQRPLFFFFFDRFEVTVETLTSTTVVSV